MITEKFDETFGYIFMYNVICLTWYQGEKNFESQWVMGYNSPVVGKWLLVLPLGIHPLFLVCVVWGGCSTSNSEWEHMIPGPSNLVHWNPLASVFVQGWAFSSEIMRQNGFSKNHCFEASFIDT